MTGPRSGVPDLAPCSHCGRPLPSGIVACPSCHTRTDGDSRSTRVPLGGGELRLVFHGMGTYLSLPRGTRMPLGRDNTWAPQASEILGDQPTVSGRHACVEHAEDGTAWLTEVKEGSTNGTRVNDRPVWPGAREQLREGDTVWLGPRVSFLIRGLGATRGRQPC
ncbi:FHA domain-containing protein [Streptomyces thermovulgaris]|uniref:FHA domain-containing protein n=1 Tax=Streptomyces thermovulgaris TaxID=1934 RepID=UPI001FEC6B9A|nr:FHA domain-containing protein [Streptomyces thermovulgaris]